MSEDGDLRPGMEPWARGWSPGPGDGALCPRMLLWIQAWCPVSEDGTLCLGMVSWTQRSCPVSGDALRCPCAQVWCSAPRSPRGSAESRACPGHGGVRGPCGGPTEGGYTPAPSVARRPRLGGPEPLECDDVAPGEGSLAQLRCRRGKVCGTSANGCCGAQVWCLLHSLPSLRAALPRPLPRSFWENMCSKCVLAALSESPVRPPVCSGSECFVQ